MPDDDRALLLAHNDLICRSCGNLRSECSDPAIDWHPRKTVCFSSAASQWALRQLQEKHPPSKKADDGAHPLDGVSVWVSQVEPPEGEDEF